MAIPSPNEFIEPSVYLFEVCFRTLAIQWQSWTNPSAGAVARDRPTGQYLTRSASTNRRSFHSRFICEGPGDLADLDNNTYSRTPNKTGTGSRLHSKISAKNGFAIVPVPVLLGVLT